MIHQYNPNQSLHLTASSTDIKTILVGGCFDVLHYGHLRFLQSAIESTDPHKARLVIALESDVAIVKTKDRRVFHSQRQRADILDALTIVSDVLMLPLLTTDKAYMALVQSVAPDIIALTQGDPRLAHKKAQAQTIDASIVEIPFVDGFSTTDLLHKYCTF